MEHDEASLPAHAHGAAGVGHEERDVSFVPLVRGLVGLVALIVVGGVVAFLVFGLLAKHAAKTSPPANPLAQSFGRQIPPEPRLQPDPLQDLQALHAQEDAALTTYGWVDRKARVVRIPIERALDLLAQRGLPAREPAAGSER